ncbi:MAG TPA: hypothetical protein VLK26_02320 [Rudaea sp.]|nr:hypothetical protein [Rudaea sp.]
MYLQALLIRAAIAIATGLMLTLAIFANHGGRAAQAATPAATIAKSARSAISEPVMLPTIHVHPTADDLAAAAARKQSPARLVIDVALPNLPAASATATPLRGSSIDMPYYSFGKVLPRIGSKE